MVVSGGAHMGEVGLTSGEARPLGSPQPTVRSYTSTRLPLSAFCMSPFLSFFPQRFAAMTLKNQLACSLSFINIVFVRCRGFLKQILNREDKCLWGGSWQTAGLSPVVCRK